MGRLQNIYKVYSQQAHNVEITSIQRWSNVLTLNWRCGPAGFIPLNPNRVFMQLFLEETSIWSLAYKASGFQIRRPFKAVYVIIFHPVRSSLPPDEMPYHLVDI